MTELTKQIKNHRFDCDLKHGDWVLIEADEETGYCEMVYEVEFANTKVILKNTDTRGGLGRLFSMPHSSVKYISPEQAMLWFLENSK